MITFMLIVICICNHLETVYIELKENEKNTRQYCEYHIVIILTAIQLRRINNVDFNLMLILVFKSCLIDIRVFHFFKNVNCQV